MSWYPFVITGGRVYDVTCSVALLSVNPPRKQTQSRPMPDRNRREVFYVGDDVCACWRCGAEYKLNQPVGECQSL